MLSPRRLLAVEDDVKWMGRWARWLAPELVILTPALTIVAARAALADARRESKFYRYVLLDLRLPDGDGMSLLRDLVRLSPQPSTPQPA